MQGVRPFGAYIAPSALYYEITLRDNGDYDLVLEVQKADSK